MGPFFINIVDDRINGVFTPLLTEYFHLNENTDNEENCQCFVLTKVGLFHTMT